MQSTFSETEKTIEFIFTESDKGKFPISRNDFGKICILDSSCPKSKEVQAGETWECEIVKDSDRVTILKPLILTRSIEHNQLTIQEKLNKLQAKYSK